MSIYNQDFIKPKTQLFTQQPNNIIDASFSVPFSNDYSCTNKPIAYVIPIERPLSKDKSIQTDSFPTEVSASDDIWDFGRSQRFFGLLEERKLPKESDNSELLLLCSRVKVLQHALDEQRTRNEELKKLLMVSLGDDLSNHFSQLMSDLSSTGERVTSLVFEKRVINDNVDLLSIEADLWKKKFVAGRILVNELADWKEQFSRRYQESLDEIHNLLQERQSIRLQLSTINDQLLHMSSHLGCNHHNRYCANTIDLVKQSLTIAKEVNRLLSSGASWDKTISNKNKSKEITEYTPGEEGALKVLRNNANLFGDTSNKYITSFSAKDQQGLEQMTLHICKNCRGDVFVV